MSKQSDDLANNLDKLAQLSDDDHAALWQYASQISDYSDAAFDQLISEELDALLVRYPLRITKH